MKRRSFFIISILQVAILAESVLAHGLNDMEQLGKKLYFDSRLSSPRGQSCASCHAPQVGWTGPSSDVNTTTAVYPGTLVHRFGNRKPPAACYASTSPIFHFDQEEGLFFGGNFWDGRATGDVLGNPAADQAQGPFLNPVEQNNPDKETVVYLVCSSKTAYLFKRVAKEIFSDPSLDICQPQKTEQAYDLIGMAIGVFEDSWVVNPYRSKFDYYLFVCEKMGIDPYDLTSSHDPTGILSDFEWRGFQLFVAPNDNTGAAGQGGNCAACHVLDAVMTPTALSQVKNKIDPNHALNFVKRPPLFTDYSFDNLGVPKNPQNPFYGMDVILIDGKPINPEGANWVDPGLGGFLVNSPNPDWKAKAEENWGKHKVPTLRNVDLRPDKSFVKAYAHNGYFKSLKGIVHFYNTRDSLDRCPELVPESTALELNCWPAPEVEANLNMTELGNLGLTDYEEDAIVAFMQTLSDKH